MFASSIPPLPLPKQGALLPILSAGLFKGRMLRLSHWGGERLPSRG